MKPLIPIACLLSAILAAPLPTREACTCQPLQSSSQRLQGYNESLASCSRISQDVERWRAAAFHRPELADLFVDYEALELSKALGIQPLSDHEKKHLQQIDSGELSKFFGKMRDPPPSRKRRRPHSAFGDPSPGRTIESRTTATFRVSPQKFQILCQPRIASCGLLLSTPVQWVLVSFILMAVAWLCLFELLVEIWLRLVSMMRRAEGNIILEGGENILSAFEAESNALEARHVESEQLDEKIDDAVVPAPADL